MSSTSTPSIANIDLTNGNQKIFAGVLLAGVLGVLYFLLPPLVEIFKNLWLLALYGVPMGLAVMNYETIWNWAKQLSWSMTKWAVSQDKIGTMYRYYDYIISRVQNLEGKLQNVSTMRVKAQRRALELKESIEKDKAEAVKLQAKGESDLVLRTIGNKVTINTKALENLLPQAANILTQENYLIKLRDNMKADAEDLKFTLDAKAEEYKLLKEISSASDSAKEFMDNNSSEFKLYKESLNQIEEAASQYIANIQNFEKDAQPFIERLSAGREVAEDEGLKLIEEYKKNTVNLKIEG